MTPDFIYKVVFRLIIAVIIGLMIGSERARHGRAAGIRTHVIVCVGSALTAMIGIFANEYLGNNGDMMRISAQVISGIGFLGAGMIILKSNNMIMGLTTAAGVWTTSIVGIAVGCGFYIGAGGATLLILLSLVIFSFFEKKRKSAEVIYIEIDDMYRANEIVGEMKELIKCNFIHKFLPPKSGKNGNLGISIVILSKSYENVMADILKLNNVVFCDEEE